MDAIQLKELRESIEKNLHDIRKANDESAEKHGKETAEMKAHWENFNAEYDALKARLDSLETKQSRLPAVEMSTAEFKSVQRAYSKHYGDKVASQITPEGVDAHRKAYMAYLAGGEKALHNLPAEQKAWILADDTSAGFLKVPAPTVDEILKNMTEVSPVRSLARVFSGQSESIRLLKRDSIMTGAWVSETGTRSETTAPTYGEINIYAHEHYVQPHASRQMLADAAIDAEAELAMEAAESLGLLEGTAFISGSGVGQPTGITTSGRVTTDTTAVSGVIDFDDLATTWYALKGIYRSSASWLLNRVMIGNVRKLKDGSGQYLWQADPRPGEPDTIFGAPVLEATDLASAFTTGNNLAIVGDFRAGYAIYDRMGMTLLRDPFTGKNSGKVEFDFYRRVGGDVRKGEALRIIQDS